MSMPHETLAVPKTYKKQMKEAYNFRKANTMKAVKKRYFSKITPNREYPLRQWMVKNYHKVLVGAIWD